MGENRLIELHGNAVSGELPPDIKSFVGCEKSRKYFDDSISRIQDELEKVKFLEPPSKRVSQRSLLPE